MHAFELRAPTAGVLKVREDHHLTDPDHLAIEVGHQNVASAAPRLFDRSPVRVDVLFVLKLRRQRSALDDERRGRDVVVGNRTNRDRHELRTRVDGREDAHALFDRLGRVQAEVLAKEVTHDLHAGRQAVGDTGGDAGGGQAQQVGGQHEAKHLR